MDGLTGNHYLNHVAESNLVNVGDLNQDVKVNRPPKPAPGVGAIIVVGGWESQPQGEGWQGADVRRTNNRGSSGEVRVLPLNGLPR